MPLDFSTPSIEGLYDVGYQTGSNLCTGLEKVFDEVFEYKKSLTDISKSQICKHVINYITNTAGKKMLKVIKDNTGLDLELKLFREFQCNFAVIWYFDKELTNASWATIWLIMSRYNGELANKVYQEYAKKYKNVKSQEELEKISREIMKDKAAVTAAMRDKHNLHGQLYFCPYTAFLAQEVYEANIEPLSSKELAAIIAHECGHVISFLVHMIDLCYKKDILYKASKSYFISADKDVQKRIALSMMKMIYPEKMEKIMDKLEEFRKKNSPKTSNLVAEMIYALLILGVRLFFGLGWAAIRCVLEVLRPVFLGPIEHILSYDPNKKSDFFEHASFGGYLDEELADEFVSKMGYTQYLTTALDKLYKWGRYSGGYTDAHGISLYTRLLPWMAATIFVGYYEDYIHPAIFDREDNAIADIIKAFKSHNLPKELEAEYYKQFKAVKALRTSKSFDRKWMVANKAIDKFLEYLIKTPYQLLIEGRFQDEYEKLFKQVQALMNNQLYALSYGLGQVNKDKDAKK